MSVTRRGFFAGALGLLPWVRRKSVEPAESPSQKFNLIVHCDLKDSGLTDLHRGLERETEALGWERMKTHEWLLK